MGLFDNILHGISCIIESLDKSNVGARSKVSSRSTNYRKSEIQISTSKAPEPASYKTRSYSGNDKMAKFVKVRRSYRTASGERFVPLWQKAGWQLNAQNPEYSIGQYKFYSKEIGKKLTWDGAIENRTYEVKVYIKNPPSFLMNHEHWECFMHQGNGWYLVHFLQRIKGLDDAILNVQRLISEAYWFC